MYLHMHFILSQVCHEIERLIDWLIDWLIISVLSPAQEFFTDMDQEFFTDMET
jgi:hypothetical protein